MSTTGSTKTADPSIRFFSFGDWGSGSLDQVAVAEQVKSFCNAGRCDFGLLLGDNFYPAGVQSTADPQWQEKFEDVYSGLDITFYAALGNHDYQGDEQSEIDYTFLQPRWKMPARAYQVAFPEGAETPLLEIFVIDSNAFDAAAGQALLQSLQDSNATWKILMMHHPIYSNGPHGSNSAGTNPSLIPIICNRVDLVLSGHDHLFSHLDDVNDGCFFQQWVVGTGGAESYVSSPNPMTLYTESNFGFAAWEVDSERIQGEFHRADGTVPYVWSESRNP